MLKPIWCRCKLYSWTRNGLYNAWIADRELRCPEPSCGRVIPVEAIKQLLIEIGMLTLDDINEDEDCEV